MNKTVIAHIDSGMRGLAALRKQNQITRANFSLRHRLAPGIQFRYGSWGGDTGSNLKNMRNQTAAIKASGRCIAAKTVRRTHQPQCVNCNIIRQFGGQSRRNQPPFKGVWFRRRGWRNSASTQQQRD